MFTAVIHNEEFLWNCMFKIFFRNIYFPKLVESLYKYVSPLISNSTNLNFWSGSKDNIRGTVFSVRFRLGRVSYSFTSGKCI